MRRCRGQRGQTAAEYLGVLFFVLSLILVFASTDFPGQVGHAVGRQICVTINRERDCDAHLAQPRAGDRRLLGERPRAGAAGRQPAGVKPVTGERFRSLGRGTWVRTSGLDRLGRPGAVEFRVDKRSARARGGDAATPRGFARAQRWAAAQGLSLHRTHLMAPEVGGPNADPANTIIAPARFAQGTMRRWEAGIDRRIARGATLDVRATPIYAGRELIPRAVDLAIYDDSSGTGGMKLLDGASLSVWPPGPLPHELPTG